MPRIGLTQASHHACLSSTPKHFTSIPVTVVPNDPATGIMPLQVGYQVLVVSINPARQQHALTDGAALSWLRGQDLQFRRPQYHFC